MQGQVVDLDDHAVDLVGEVVAVLLQLAAPGDDLGDADLPDLGADREAGPGQLGEGVDWVAVGHAALAGAPSTAPSW